MDAGLLRPRTVSVHHRPPTARLLPVLLLDFEQPQTQTLVATRTAKLACSNRVPAAKR